MFLTQFLQPKVFIGLVKMLLACQNKIALLNVGLFANAKIIKFKVNNEKYTFLLRTRGDIAIVFEMFFLKVYPFEMFEGEINNVLDLGAHIGIPAIIMGKKNNINKIYSMEPVIENYDVLVQNIELNGLTGKVIPINAGIGSKDEVLQINKSSSTNSHSIVMDEGNGVKEEINVLSIQSVMNQNSVTKFDLIKMDIEGYEYNVFESLASIVSGAKYFSMERHDIKGHDFETEINQKVLEIDYELKSILNPGPVYTFQKK